jgi:hypothetical protein
LWIATRPGMLLCNFCYQAAQVLAEDIICTACGHTAGDPDTDAIVVAKAADWLGVHFYMCQSCTELDLH